MTKELAGSKAGRILLHLCCMVHRDHKVRWHWEGIKREFVIKKKHSETTENGGDNQA